MVQRLLLLACLGACATPVEVGGGCTDTSDCRGGLVCVDRPGAMPASQCMMECDPDMTRLCMGGAVCMALGASATAPGACYLGGSVAVGAACQEAMASTDCIAGSLCICRGTMCACEEACRMGDMMAMCPAGQMCTLLMPGGMDGFCEPTP